VWSEIISAVASGSQEENARAFESTNAPEHLYIDIGKVRYKFWKEHDFFFMLPKKRI
jgi:hypothetical protein